MNINSAMSAFSNFLMGSDLNDGAYFEPSEFWEVDAIVELLDIKEGDMSIDLGSGDGRIVVAMAKAGSTAYGIEKNPALVQSSKDRIKAAGYTDKAHIIHSNIWVENLSRFNKVAIFQYHTVMAKLQKKLLRELPKDALVVSHHWQFPDWKPIRNIEDIYLYQKYT